MNINKLAIVFVSMGRRSNFRYIHDAEHANFWELENYVYWRDLVKVF